MQQPSSLAKHLKLKSMHLNTRNNDQLLLQHPSVGTNSYGTCAFSYTVPSVWNKVSYYIRNAPSVISFTKHLKRTILDICWDRLMAVSCLVRKSYRFWHCQICGHGLWLMFQGFASRFWVPVQQIGYMK